MTPWRAAVAAGCVVALLLGLLAGVEVAKHADVQYLQGERVTLTQTLSQPGQTRVVTRQVTTRVTQPVGLGSTIYITQTRTVHKPPVTVTHTITSTSTVTETVTTTGTTGP